jgi:hypothetical protein
MFLLKFEGNLFGSEMNQKTLGSVGLPALWQSIKAVKRDNILGDWTKKIPATPRTPLFSRLDPGQVNLGSLAHCPLFLSFFD